MVYHKNEKGIDTVPRRSDLIAAGATAFYCCWRKAVAILSSEEKIQTKLFESNQKKLFKKYEGRQKLSFIVDAEMCGGF